MLLANFNGKEHLRHRAVSLRQHGFLVNYIFGKVSRIDCLHMIQTKCFRYVVINQSIRTHLYSATRRKRIRGARWQGLGQVFTVSSVNSTVNSSVFNVRAKVLKSLQDLQLNERELQTVGVLTLKALTDSANDVRGAVSK